MPDTKISGLPVASTVSDADQVEVLQSGANKRSLLSVLKTLFYTNAVLTGNSSQLAPVTKTLATRDAVAIVAAAATGTINFDALTSAAQWYTTNATANWTLNIRGDGTNTLDSLMAVGDSISIVFRANQGSTAFYNNVLQVDGTTRTVKWLGGTAPSSGNASASDVYAYTITKTAANTFDVLGSQSKFA